MLLMAGLAAFATEFSVQDSVWSARQQARQLDNTKQLEHLILGMNGSSLVVKNDGLVPSQLQYLLRQANGSTSDSRLGDQLQVGASAVLPVPSQQAGYAVVTLLGNVFWLQDPSQGVSQAAFGSVPVTFDASGLSPAFNSSSVLTVDGQSITYSQLPRTYEWQVGSSHSYSYASGFPTGPSERVGWENSRGLTTSRQGTLSVSQPGSIISQYSNEYLLAVVGGSGLNYLASPSNDGWYPAGSTAQVSTSYSWNLTAGQSRQNLLSWGVDGSSVTTVARSGDGTFVTSGIVMNAPHTLTFDSVTQYLLSTSTSIPASGVLAPLSVGYSYTGPVSTSWSCPQFSLSGLGTGTASQGLCPEPQPSQEVTSVSWTITITQSGTPGDSLSFYIAVNSCPSSSYGASGGSSGSFSGCMPESGASIVLQWSVGQGCVGGKHGGANPVYCGTSFAISSSGTYTYASSSSGSTSTSGASFSAAGSTVAYSYPFEYAFPSNSTSTSLTVTYPGSETFTSLSPTCGSWRNSANTVAITGACPGQYVLTTSASGSYSVTLGASPTGDGWYDAGSSISLSAAESGPFAFFGWASSTSGLEIASSTAPSTTVVVDSAGTITAVYNVVE